MADLILQDPNAIARSYGRGVVFYATATASEADLAPVRWNPAQPLYLKHLGDTEGDITFTPNAEVSVLTTPEVSGPAPIEADYTGEAPTLEMPLYLADPTLLAIVSPNGSGSAGRSLRLAANEVTLAIFPESLFIGLDGDGVPARLTLAVSNGTWTLDGDALTPAQEGFLSVALWAWRCVFQRPPRRFLGGSGDARKQIESVTATLMQHPDLPEGHKLYTIGDPELVNIALDGQS